LRAEGRIGAATFVEGGTFDDFVNRIRCFPVEARGIDGATSSDSMPFHMMLNGSIRRLDDIERMRWNSTDAKECSVLGYVKMPVPDNVLPLSQVSFARPPYRQLGRVKAEYMFDRDDIVSDRLHSQHHSICHHEWRAQR